MLPRPAKLRQRPSTPTRLITERGCRRQRLSPSLERIDRTATRAGLIGLGRSSLGAAPKTEPTREVGVWRCAKNHSPSRFLLGHGPSPSPHCIENTHVNLGEPLATINPGGRIPLFPRGVHL